MHVPVQEVHRCQPVVFNGHRLPRKDFDLIEEIRSSLSLIVPIESLLMKEKSLGEDQDSFAVNQTIVDTQRCVNAMNNQDHDFDRS